MMFYRPKADQSLLVIYNVNNAEKSIFISVLKQNIRNYEIQIQIFISIYFIFISEVKVETPQQRRKVGENPEVDALKNGQQGSAISLASSTSTTLTQF